MVWERTSELRGLWGLFLDNLDHLGEDSCNLVRLRWMFGHGVWSIHIYVHVSPARDRDREATSCVVGLNQSDRACSWLEDIP